MGCYGSTWAQVLKGLGEYSVARRPLHQQLDEDLHSRELHSWTEACPGTGCSSHLKAR